MTTATEHNPLTLSAVKDAANVVVTTLKSVRKSWPMVVACAVFFVGASFVFAKSQPKVYDATSLIELNSTVTKPISNEKSQDLLAMGDNAWDSQIYNETQYRIVLSQRVLAQVTRNLHLNADQDFTGVRNGEHEVTVDDAADILRGRVRVEPVKNSHLFLLHVEDTDAKRAKRICQDITTTYIDQNLQNAVSSTSDAAVWLGTQLDHVKQELEVNENALYEFKQKNELPSTSINEVSNMQRLELQAFMEALSHTRTREQELLARQAELSKIPLDDPGQIAASELLTNTFLSKLRADYEDVKKQRATLLGEGKGEEHPLVRAASVRLSETKAALVAEVSNIKQSVDRDLAIIQRQEAGDAALYEEARRRAVELNMKEIEYHRLDRARDQNEKLYAMLLERTKEADLARMMRVNNIEAVDMPLEPQVPVRPRVALYVILGLLLGLFVGVLAAYVRDALDNSIKTPEDVEAELARTFLGLLPEVEEGQAPTYSRYSRRRHGRNGAKEKPPEHMELIVHERPASGVAEAARAVRTNLMFMNPDRRQRTLLVTSSAPSEGKTTVACSLAIAFAQGGQRVCVVDCDLRRPRLHRIFGRAGDAGLTNVLIGDATIAEVARPTQVENLWCIPAGPLPPNPADMLHSDRFRKLLADLGEQFDRVIIDSAPLVAVTDSAIVSTLVDGTLFVVRAFKTARTLARHGLRALTDVDSRVTGVVLNAVNLARHEYTYYHHYYYYKRDGYAPLATKSDESDAGKETSASPPN